MSATQDDGFEVVGAQGPGIIPQIRAKTRRSPRTKLPPFPKAASPSCGPDSDFVVLHTSHADQQPSSTSPVKRKRANSTVSRSDRRSSSPSEVDELEEGPSRRYRRPSDSPTASKGDVSSKATGKGKRKGKAADKDAKPKKPSKAASERAKLEEIRKDRHFRKLDEATVKRIAKAHHERLYLIHRYRDGEQPREAFDVCGSKGNVYKVLVDRNVGCTCMDFKLRRQVCKHLLFVYIKVLRLPSHLPVYANIRLSEGQVQQVFDEALNDPVAHALANPELRDAWKKAVGYTSDGESGPSEAPVGKRLIPDEGDVCGVCYEDLEPGSVEGLEFCLESCGRPIHTDCLETWFKTRGFARTCIWCRAKWHDPYQNQAQGSQNHDGYSVGLGHRGAVVDSSGRQLNLADAAGLGDTAAAGVADAANPEDHDPDALPDAADLADVDNANEASGWD